MPQMLKRFCLVLVAIACISAERELYGQQQDTTGSIAIVNKSLGVLVSSGQPLHDITLQGTVEYIAGSTDETGTATLKAVTDGSIRTEITLPSQTIRESVIRSGSRLSGQKDDGKTALHATALHNLMTDSAWFCPVILMQHYAEFAQRGEVTAATKTDQNGTVVNELTSYRHFTSGTTAMNQKYQQLTTTALFVDAASSQPTSYTFDTHSESNLLDNIHVKVSYEDYKQFDGILVPTHIKKYINGVLLLDIHIASVAVNNGLVAAQLSLQ